MAEREKSSNFSHRVKCENDEAPEYYTSREKRALLSEMMINDCHEYYHRQPLTSRKRFSAKNESTEEFNKISFFIFLFMFFLPSMGFLTLLTIKLVSSDSLAENDLLKRSPWPYEFSMEIRRT